jgi:hypothetical protein
MALYFKVAFKVELLESSIQRMALSPGAWFVPHRAPQTPCGAFPRDRHALRRRYRRALLHPLDAGMLAE